jgi:predicted Zn-dependent peptidase
LNQQIYSESLPNGIRVNFIPASKFKTISFGLFLHQELREDLASMTALLPSVLERGSHRYPDTLTLRRELELLYGAELSTDIIKKGERHLISCSLEMVHGQYVGERESLLGKGLSILGNVIGEPLVEGSGFKQDYVAQEKDQLGKEIKGLINDKALYALEKCFSAMCAGERFGVFKLGTVEGLEGINPAALWDYYQELFAQNPMELYVVGDLEPERVFEAAREMLQYRRRPRQDGLSPTEIYKEPGQLREKAEILPVNQAKLVLGYRTNISYGDPLYSPLLMYNGILGGFPHSKLFMNVREKAGLAYYVYSRLERHKGVMAIAAGIDGGDYEKARGIIEEQVEAMASGQISELELENTRRGLVNHLRSVEDSPYQMINFHLDGAIGGRDYTIAELIQDMEAVTPEEIIAAAGKIRPDTVYLLRGRQGGGN